MDRLERFLQFLIDKNVEVQNETLDLEYKNDKLGRLEKGGEENWWYWLNENSRDAERLRELNRMQNLTHDFYGLIKEFLKGEKKR